MMLDRRSNFTGEILDRGTMLARRDSVDITGLEDTIGCYGEGRAQGNDAGHKE
jgi:hypothetical protein